MSITRHCLISCIVLSPIFSYSQIRDSSLKVVSQLPDRYYTKVDKKISSVDDQLTKKSLKYLAKFQKQERKLQRKIQRIHPDSFMNVLAGADEKYKEFSQKIKSKATGITKLISGEYNPNLDSLGSSLSFLKQFDGISDKVKKPLESLNQLQGKLAQSEKIKEFITQRKNQIKEVLAGYTKLPPGLKKQYADLSKTAYYYKAQLKEYKETLKDPQKIEQKALGILNKLPDFQKFMKKNSQLAVLFKLPDNKTSLQSLTGLQTRSSVQALVQQRISTGGPNAQAQIQSNLAIAHTEFKKLKDKLNGLAGGGGDIAMPEFKPNNQKTKKFLKRLEYSADLQFSKGSSLMPSGANIGVGIGYKLNDKVATGIGLSYKLGMGSIQHIAFTSQAIGLRSYMDWKIKKQIFATSGYEMNYNTVFKSIEQLKDYDAWQRSALLGISKRYKISKKVKGEIKILYDFLANTHTPVTQPVLFRFGYKF